MLKVTKLVGDKTGVLCSSKSSSLRLALPQLLPPHMISLYRRIIPTNTYLQRDLSLSISTTFFIESTDQTLCYELGMYMRATASKRDDTDSVLTGLAIYGWTQLNTTHCSKTPMGKVQGMAQWHGKATYPDLRIKGDSHGDRRKLKLEDT